MVVTVAAATAVAAAAATVVLMASAAVIAKATVIWGRRQCGADDVEQCATHYSSSSML